MLTRSVRTGLGQVICKWNILATPSVLVAAFCFLQGEFLWTSGADVGLFLPVNLAIQSLASSLHIDVLEFIDLLCGEALVAVFCSAYELFGRYQGVPGRRAGSPPPWVSRIYSFDPGEFYIHAVSHGFLLVTNADLLAGSVTVAAAAELLARSRRGRREGR